MIPFTDICVTKAHVPPYPILTNTNNPHYVNTFVHEPRIPCPTPMATTPLPSRRGRRSTVPPEIREQTRRLKKQNMERRRRACISDKMNALHNLALSLVGVDPQESPKVEKADILSICYTVFEGIAKIANDDPDLKIRLHRLRNCLREPSTSSRNSLDNLNLIDETTRSSCTMSEDSCSRTSSPQHPQNRYPNDDENKENQTPLPSVTLIGKMPLYPTHNPVLQPIEQWHSTPLNPTKLRIHQSCSDSGFQSFQSSRTNSATSPIQSPSLQINTQSAKRPRPDQDHVFPKPCSVSHPVVSQNRSAFTPIRQSKTSPNPVFMSPPPLPVPAHASSSHITPVTLPTTTTSPTSQSTPVAMWRPYLD